MANVLTPQTLPPLDPSQIDPLTGFLKSENPQFTAGEPYKHPEPSWENAANKLKEIAAPAANVLGIQPAVQPGFELRGPQAVAAPAPAPVQPQMPAVTPSATSSTDHVEDTRTKAQPTSAATAINGLPNSFNAVQAAAEQKAEADMTELKAREEIYNKQVLESQNRAALVERAGNAAISDFESTKREMDNYKFQDYWADKSTGQKVMAGIAIALGGVGGMYAGDGRNRAIEIIDKEIDRDLNLQKLNYGQLKDKGENAKSLYGLYMQKYNNEAMASSATAAALLNASAARLEQIAAPYESAKTKLNFEMLKGQLMERSAAQMGTLQKNAQLQAGLQNGSIDIRNLTPIQQREYAAAIGDKDFPERYVDGWGEASNSTKAKKFDEYRAEVEPTLDLARDAYDTSKRLNLKDKLMPSERGALESKLVILAGKLRLPITGPGTLTPEEYARLRDALGDSKKIFKLTTNAAELKKLETVINWLGGDLETRAKQAGLQPKVRDINFGEKTPSKK